MSGQAGFFLSPKLRIAAVPGKGRGLLAAAPFAAGELVERSPVLPCRVGDIPAHGHPFSEHVFLFGEGRLAFGLGYASLYNHSRNPTCSLDFEDAPEAIVFRALRPVLAGEELTIDYVVPLWFRES